LGPGNRFLPVPGLSHHLDVRLLSQDGDQSSPEELVVINDEYLDGFHSGGGSPAHCLCSFLPRGGVTRVWGALRTSAAPSTHDRRGCARSRAQGLSGSRWSAVPHGVSCRNRGFGTTHRTLFRCRKLYSMRRSTP